MHLSRANHCLFSLHVLEASNPPCLNQLQLAQYGSAISTINVESMPLAYKVIQFCYLTLRMWLAIFSVSTRESSGHLAMDTIARLKIAPTSRIDSLYGCQIDEWECRANSAERPPTCNSRSPIERYQLIGWSKTKNVKRLDIIDKKYPLWFLHFLCVYFGTFSMMTDFISTFNG